MPSPLLIDADQYDLVFIHVDGVDDVLRRLQRYFVLGRSTAKDDSDTDFYGHGVGLYDFEVINGNPSSSLPHAPLSIASRRSSRSSIRCLFARCRFDAINLGCQSDA